MTMSPTRPLPTTEGRILRLLATQGPMHRAAIAGSLGLSRSRVTGAVTALLAQGALAEELAGRWEPAKDGRAGPALHIPSGFLPVTGIQITNRHITVIVSALSGEVLAKRDTGLTLGERSPARITDEVCALVADAQSSARVHHLAAAGIGFFGLIDPATGAAITHPRNAWSGVEIGKTLQEALGVPTVVENNSRLEAIAEAQWGAGRGSDPMIYVHLSVGITATLVIDGVPLRGARGGAGELGHVCVEPTGPLCACGSRGCLHLYASSSVIEGALGSPDESGEFKGALAAFDSGDPKAERVFHEAADAVARAIASAATLLDPATIVIGGDLSRAGARFLERLRSTFREHAYAFAKDSRFALADFGGSGSGGARAAAFLARQYVAEERVDFHRAN